MVTVFPCLEERAVLCFSFLKYGHRRLCGGRGLVSNVVVYVQVFWASVVEYRLQPYPFCSVLVKETEVRMGGANGWHMTKLWHQLCLAEGWSATGYVVNVEGATVWCRSMMASWFWYTAWQCVSNACQAQGGVLPCDTALRECHEGAGGLEEMAGTWGLAERWLEATLVVPGILYTHEGDCA